MTRGRSHGNLRDRSLTDLSRLGTPAHASRCPNQRRNIMSTTEKDGIAGPKQDEDLRSNPGIGQSKGTPAAGEKVEEIEGDNTVEGDIENDPDAAGGVDPNRLGRTNKYPCVRRCIPRWSIGRAHV